MIALLPALPVPRLRTFCLTAFLSCTLPAALTAQTGPQQPATLPASAHTLSGIEFSDSALTLRVDALRSDVLRVRMYPNPHPAEDASWSVLPTSRIARIPVIPEPDGFTPHTSHATAHSQNASHTTALERTPLGWAATLPDTGQPQTIVLQ